MAQPVSEAGAVWAVGLCDGRGFPAPAGDAVQLVIEIGLPAGPALHLAAGCLENLAAFEDQDLGSCQAMAPGHCLTDAPEDRLPVRRAPSGFGKDDELFFGPVLHREGGAMFPPYLRAGFQHRPFDVMGVMVHSGDDDEILQAAGDMQRAVLQETEIACAQERAGFRAIGKAGFECGVRFFRPPPVAEPDAGAGYPDLADLIGRATAPGFGVDDPQICSGPGHAAAHHRPRRAIGLAGVGGQHAVVLQRPGIKLRDARVFIVGAGGDKQRGFGHAVSRIEGFGPEALRGECLGETPQGFGPDRLGPVAGDLPAGQVQRGALFVLYALKAEFIGEVRGMGMGAAEPVDRLQPADGPFKQGKGREDIAIRAAKEGLQEAFDQTVIMEIGHPGDADAVFTTPEAFLKIGQVGEHVSVGQHDAARTGGGA